MGIAGCIQSEQHTNGLAPGLDAELSVQVGSSPIGATTTAAGRVPEVNVS